MCIRDSPTTQLKPPPVTLSTWHFGLIFALARPRMSCLCIFICTLAPSSVDARTRPQVPAAKRRVERSKGAS
eukprot:3600003-Pyramimonas_sp.AAC.1